MGLYKYLKPKMGFYIKFGSVGLGFPASLRSLLCQPSDPTEFRQHWEQNVLTWFNRYMWLWIEGKFYLNFKC